MSDRELSIVAGALSRHQKPKATQQQDAIAKRWRISAPCAPAADQPAGNSDVISLLDGWIRRLEKEAGSTSVAR
jgi:hypothetical protein